MTGTTGSMLFFSGGLRQETAADEAGDQLADPKVGDMIGQARHEQA